MYRKVVKRPLSGGQRGGHGVARGADLVQGGHGTKGGKRGIGSSWAEPIGVVNLVNGRVCQTGY